MSRLKYSSKALGGSFALLALFLPLFTSAQADRSYDYERIFIAYRVHEDATVSVEERQTYAFMGAYHQGERIIPHKGSDAVTDISVTDAATGQRLRYSSGQLEKTDPASWGAYTFYTQNGSTYVDWYYDLSNTTHTWIIRYTLHGAISFYSDHDEFYWNLFDSYSVPVKRVEAVVLLPVPNTNPSATFYVLGNHDVVSDRPDPSTFHFSAYNFRPHEAATIAVGWQKGVVSKDAYLLDALQTFWPLSLSALIVMLTIIFGGIYAYRHRYGGGGRGTIVPEYEPPGALPPAMGEVMATGKMSSRTWPATIVSLAVRGYLTITEEQGNIWSFYRKDYVLTRTPVPEVHLEKYEQDFLEALFGNHTVFSTREMRKSPEAGSRLYGRLQNLRLKLYREMATDNPGIYIVDPRKAVTGQKIIAGVVFVVVLLLFATGPDAISLSYYLLVSVVLICGAIAVVLAKYKEELTPPGQELRDKWRGFKLYLETAERYRVQNLTPETFEKFLPYAMVFGIEKKWAKAFDAMNLPPPNWYVGNTVGIGPHSSVSGFSSGFSAATFTSSFSASLSTAFSSSGGGASGGGGGGGAGGGGGGGGGGAS